MTWMPPQPSVVAVVTAYTSAAIPAVAVTAEDPDSLLRDPGGAGRTTGARTTTRAAIGAPTKNTHRHEVTWVRMPPTTRPVTAPMPAMAA